ncbi:MAG: HD-GYP domain-containing protein [Gaiellaceae bacterium]
MSTRPAKDAGSAVSLLITLAAIAASTCLVLLGPPALHVFADHPVKAATFVLLALCLQLLSVEVYGKGSIGVSAIGLLAAAFSLGAGPAVLIAFVAAVLQWARRRGALHKAIFDAANFTLSTAAGAAVFVVLDPLADSTAVTLAAASVAGLAYGIVNNGLLCVAMSLSEGLTIQEVWRERFHWARFHVLAFGPLAVATAIAYEKTGISGLLAFALPPVLLVISVRQYQNHTRDAVEEVREKNRALGVANQQLAERNEDLNELFQFAGGLSARAHDRSTLVSYAEEALGRLTGAQARIEVGGDGAGIGLLAAGNRIGSLSLSEGADFDEERWQRLRDAILPQLSTALESTELVEKVRKKHLATIAALSRSMEAKDYYTGGHTERVAEVSVALGRRLGYSASDLEAIEIGALLHDIGKIGIPERILHKPGPLDDEEWKVMKEHPVISAFILKDVDLHPFVLQIAESSHERIDGAGYPKGLSGETIPLPARIVLVADALDALTSDRPYRRGRSITAALDEMRAHSGTQFCPRVIDALEQLFRFEPAVLGTGTHLRAVEAA